jgi:hypothetical protein
MDLEGGDPLASARLADARAATAQAIATSTRIARICIVLNILGLGYLAGHLLAGWPLPWPVAAAYIALMLTWIIYELWFQARIVRPFMDAIERDYRARYGPPDALG